MKSMHWRMTTLALTAIVVILLSFKPIHAQSPVILNVTFHSLRQGTAGILVLDGPTITSATVSAFGTSYPCFLVSRGYACLVAVPMEEVIKDYPLTTTVMQEDGTEVQWKGTVKVISGQFVTEPDFTLRTDKAALLQPEVEQTDEARLTAIYSLVTPETFWTGSFRLPTAVGKPTSPFGSTRLYRNDGRVRRHTGYDLSVPVGTPVQGVRPLE